MIVFVFLFLRISLIVLIGVTYLSNLSSANGWHYWRQNDSRSDR